MEQASELFMDMVCDGGTPSIDCELCGRTHFATGPQSCEDEDEIARLRKLATEQPDKYCESDDDSISFGSLAGIQVVYDCPCHKLRRYEDFIWDNRALILSYVKARTHKELDAATKTMSQLESL
jgi:hypothetical protein